VIHRIAALAIVLLLAPFLAPAQDVIENIEKLGRGSQEVMGRRNG